MDKMILSQERKNYYGLFGFMSIIAIPVFFYLFYLIDTLTQSEYNFFDYAVLSSIVLLIIGLILSGISQYKNEMKYKFLGKIGLYLSILFLIYFLFCGFFGSTF